MNISLEQIKCHTSDIGERLNLTEPDSGSRCAEYNHVWQLCINLITVYLADAANGH